jgi:hypothetical protein
MSQERYFSGRINVPSLSVYFALTSCLLLYVPAKQQKWNQAGEYKELYSKSASRSVVSVGVLNYDGLNAYLNTET